MKSEPTTTHRMLLRPLTWPKSWSAHEQAHGHDNHTHKQGGQNHDRLPDEATMQSLFAGAGLTIRRRINERFFMPSWPTATAILRHKYKKILTMNQKKV